MHRQTIANWGNFPKIEADWIEVADGDQLFEEIADKRPLIARGNGRCYGDSSLQQTIISTLKMNKMLLFDRYKGILRCESGVLLGDILKVIVPAGFFLPVTPGTKYVTIGGAVASNVHGKNHHTEGAFARYVLSLDLMTEDGRILSCSRAENKALFADTIGGMGLTGVILTVTICLKKIETAFIKQKTIKTTHLEDTLDHLEQYKNATYSVTWMDCLKKGPRMGRGLLMLGEHARSVDLRHHTEQLKVHSDHKINIPFYFPNFTLNPLTVKWFNTLYYHKQWNKEQQTIVHYNPFFYPLDILDNWNRMYGSNGFTQYQFVVPFECGREALRHIMNEIANSGCASFLAVLKTFGAADDCISPLSFPTEGYTLALDLPLSHKVLSLLDRLDEMVLAYKGRLYLTKDARMSKEMFAKTYSTFYRGEKFLSAQILRLT